MELTPTSFQRMPPYLFQMDRRLSVFSLRPSDGFSVESVLEDFCMQDVVSVFKGQEVCNRVPFLGRWWECLGARAPPQQVNVQARRRCPLGCDCPGADPQIHLLTCPVFRH